MQQRKLYIKTFGCQMNERDSEIIEQLLYPSGFVPCNDIETADLVILNTCSVRAKAEQKVYSLLGQIRQYKLNNPGMLVAVAGCVAQQEKDRIKQRMPHVNIVVGTQQIYKLPEMIERIDSGINNLKPEIELDTSFTIPSFNALLQSQAKKPSAVSAGFKKFVTIMQGCNNFCSYCVVPLTRGREISRPVKDILLEVQHLVSQGICEITLLGQNVNSFGQTNPVADSPVDFAELLHLVSATPGLKRLRFTTSNPKDLSDDLMRCFAELDNLCPQFHLPVQSGSNTILSKMNRKYTISDYLEKVATLRKYRPDIALATDMIIGFPGETDEDFEATMALLETVRFHSSFSFKYSDRPGTRAADFDNPVPEEVKSERLSRFQKRQDEISLELNRGFIDRILEVIVEGTGKNSLMYGRSATNHIVHFPPAEYQLNHGDIVQVHIDKAGQHSLAGTIIDKGEKA